MSLLIKAPIAGLHKAKTPPTWCGGFLEDTVPLCVFVLVMVAFLWAPAVLGM